MQLIPISVLITIIWLGIIRMKSGKGKVRFSWACEVIALEIMISIIFMLTGITFMSGFSTQIMWSKVSYIPLHSITEMIRVMGFTRYVIVNIFGNILMFMPIGFLIPLAFPKQRHLWSMALWGLITSLLIEFTQLFIIRGTDIDDVILNTLGAILGYVVFRVFYLCFKKRIKESDKCLPKSALGRMTPLICIMIPYLCGVLIGFLRIR